MTTAETPNGAEARRGHVLLVDDDPLVRQIVSHILARDADLRVSYIGHPAGLVERAEALAPDVILLDYELPGAPDGASLRPLIESPALRGIPIVVLSVHEDPAIKASCLDQGAADYLVKFPHRREFAARVRAQIERSRRARGVEDDALGAPAATPPTVLFAGRYRVDGVLGAGAFATIYRAWHHGLNAHVALKVLRPERVAEEDARAYFRVEGPAAFRIQHRNVVAVYDAGVAESGQLFVAMELIEGVTLRERLAGGPRPRLAEACGWLADAADALGAAHQVGVLHRDVKPSNLMIVAATGAVKVVDFGLAQVSEWRDGEPHLIVGTPAYMSPERIEGAAETGKSDVYSLAAVAYEVLAGQRVFGGRDDTPQAMSRRHVDEVPVPLDRLVPEVPGAISFAVMTALAKAPAERPTVEALAQTFRDAAR